METEIIGPDDAAYAALRENARDDRAELLARIAALEERIAILEAGPTKQ